MRRRATRRRTKVVARNRLCRGSSVRSRESALRVTNGSRRSSSARDSGRCLAASRAVVKRVSAWRCAERKNGTGTTERQGEDTGAQGAKTETPANEGGGEGGGEGEEEGEGGGEEMGEGGEDMGEEEEGGRESQGISSWRGKDEAVRGGRELLVLVCSLCIIGGRDPCEMLFSRRLCSPT